MVERIEGLVAGIKPAIDNAARFMYQVSVGKGCNEVSECFCDQWPNGVLERCLDIEAGRVDTLKRHRPVSFAVCACLISRKVCARMTRTEGHQ